MTLTNQSHLKNLSHIAMSPATKKQKVARHQEAGDEDEDVSMGEQADDSENDASEEGLTSSDDTNTDTEIALAQQTKKSKKTSSELSY